MNELSYRYLLWAIYLLLALRKISKGLLRFIYGLKSYAVVQDGEC